MGREIRVVPPDWQHPVENDQYKPLRRNEMPSVCLEDQPKSIQMYETTTKGTPVSPVMNNSEKLAQWLVENKVSAYSGQTTSYEAWLMLCQGKSVIHGGSTNLGHTRHNRMEYKETLQQTYSVPDAFDKINQHARATKKRSRERG